MTKDTTTMSEDRHTPGPWKIGDREFGGSGKGICEILGADGNWALTMTCLAPDAERIVLCVNNHDALLQAGNDLADAVEVWFVDPTQNASSALVAARSAYRSIAKKIKGAAE